MGSGLPASRSRALGDVAQRRSAGRVGRKCGEVREVAPSGLSMLADAALHAHTAAACCVDTDRVLVVLVADDAAENRAKLQQKQQEQEQQMTVKVNAQFGIMSNSCERRSALLRMRAELQLYR